MARGDSTEPTAQRKLTNKELLDRKNLLVDRRVEYEEIAQQKSEQTKKLNASLNLLDEQMSTICKEIKTGFAWVPRAQAGQVDIGVVRGGRTVTPEEADAIDGEEDYDDETGEVRPFDSKPPANGPEEDDEEIVDPVDHPPAGKKGPRRGAKKKASRRAAGAE